MFLSFELDAYVVTLNVLEIHCTSPQAFQTFSFYKVKKQCKLIWSNAFMGLVEMLDKVLKGSKCMGHKFRKL